MPLNQFIRKKVTFMKNNVYDLIKYQCVGCGSCEAICPKSCINLKEKKNIGILPFVNNNECINCGVCIDVCPTLMLEKKEDLNKIKTIFIGKSTDDEIIKNSSSGGIVSSIIIDRFDKQEIDAALVAFYDDNLNIYGDIITSKKEVLNHSGSFYHTSKLLKNIKKIKNYNSVLLVGLPCQNVAFELYAEKYQIKNIYGRISLFCTIGRMKNGFIEYLKENNFSLDPDNIVIKYKSRYGVDRLGPIIIETSKGESINFDCGDYLQSKDYFYIPNGCLYCRKLFGVDFADISVGDDWGINTKQKTAIFTVNSNKGMEIIENNNLIYREISNMSKLKKSQPIGFALKYSKKTKVIYELKILKFFYRVLPKNSFFKKVLFKIRTLILRQIQRIESEKF